MTESSQENQVTQDSSFFQRIGLSLGLNCCVKSETDASQKIKESQEKFLKDLVSKLLQEYPENQRDAIYEQVMLELESQNPQNPPTPSQPEPPPDLHKEVLKSVLPYLE